MQYQDRPKILLVDDDVDLLKSAEILLRDAFDIFSANSVQIAKAVARNQSLDVAVVDLNFEGQEADGIDLIDWALKEKAGLSIIVLSGDDSTKRVVEATRRPLVDFIPKSGDYERDLRFAIQRGFELKKSRSDSPDVFTFQTRSPRMRRVLDTVDRIARSGSSCSLLFMGESGSGKEVLAKHYAARAGKRMVAANMASIPKEMAESQLFGHVRGAFTGAHADQIGLISQAHNGIFFLDELGECSPTVQAKLLRALQESEVHPLGGKRTIKVDVQFIAATNCNLEKMVERGDFRLDLLQRINAVTIHLPPLRERPEDIEFYATLFLNELSSDKPFAVKASGVDALLGHSWRGNTRELRNLIQRIVLLSDRRELSAQTVQAAMLGGEASCGSAETGALISNYQKLRGEILAALEKAHGNRTQAAEALMMHRTTLIRWIKKFGIGNTISPRPGRPMLALAPEFSEETI